MNESTASDADPSPALERLTATIGLEEVGKLLRCSPETVRKMAKAGEIPGTKVVDPGCFTLSSCLNGWPFDVAQTFPSDHSMAVRRAPQDWPRGSTPGATNPSTSRACGALARISDSAQ